MGRPALFDEAMPEDPYARYARLRESNPVHYDDRVEPVLLWRRHRHRQGRWSRP
ncbi:hypothetical protein [Streptomyces sp. NPDC059459]|uniref:hypothetical protein n=1 Tax=unclassified Streptomyces TaxID=2593676 RepID=UPI0036B4A30D